MFTAIWRFRRRLEAAFAHKMVQREVQWLQIASNCALLVWAEQLKTLRPR